MKDKKNRSLSWFISPLLITILGAMSLLLLFLMQYYDTGGIFFWIIVISWVIILITISLIFCVQENHNRRLRKKQSDLIQKLSEEIENHKGRNP